MKYNDEDREKEIAQYLQDQPKKKQKYLEDYIFYGLTNLNDGFDANSIYYFSESDFETILTRVEKKGLAIYGIEPWLNKCFYDVKVADDYHLLYKDPAWYWNAFNEFKKSGEPLLYSATYGIPKKRFMK